MSSEKTTETTDGPGIGTEGDDHDGDTTFHAFWADSVADEIEAREPEEPIVIKGGVSPSGIPHLGHFNEILRGHFVAEVLRERFAGVVPEDLVAGVETGACPHTGIREDPSMNLSQIDDFVDEHPGLDIVIVESGGDNLAATFNPELADYSLYVISAAEGEDIPRKRGPGVVECDLLVVNKTDLAEHVGADLAVMEADAKAVRDGPFVFTNCKDSEGVDEVLEHVSEGVLFA